MFSRDCKSIDLCLADRHPRQALFVLLPALGGWVGRVGLKSCALEVLFTYVRGVPHNTDISLVLTSETRHITRFVIYRVGYQGGTTRYFAAKNITPLAINREGR